MPEPTTLWCGILSFEAPVRPAAVVEANREALGAVIPSSAALVLPPHFFRGRGMRIFPGPRQFLR